VLVSMSFSALGGIDALDCHHLAEAHLGTSQIYGGHTFHG
jgi:hypothetical protein